MCTAAVCSYKHKHYVGLCPIIVCTSMHTRGENCCSRFSNSHFSLTLGHNAAEIPARYVIFFNVKRRYWPSGHDRDLSPLGVFAHICHITPSFVSFFFGKTCKVPVLPGSAGMIYSQFSSRLCHFLVCILSSPHHLRKNSPHGRFVI